MEISFKNKVVLVTGASRGIGREIAKMFSEASASVVIHYNKNHHAAERTLSMLIGSNHYIIQADISDPVSIDEMVKKAINKYGRVDVLVNNAGIYEEVPIANQTYQQWQENWHRTISTNLTGPANLSFCIIEHMKRCGGGKIVNITSRGAFRGEPDASAYGASKAGLNSFGQSMAKALAPDKIYVFTIAPGFVETDMSQYALKGEQGEAIKNQSPLGRVAQPEEIARAALFFASQGTEYMTGCVVDINGASYLRT